MTRAPLSATLALVACVASACAAPGSGLPERPAEVPTETIVAGVAVPAPVTNSAAAPVSPATTPTTTPTPLPASVEVLQPDYVVDAGTELDDEVLAKVEQLPGLEAVARVASVDVTLSGPRDVVQERVMVVGPNDFRPLTPEVTAQAVGVWERLAAGDAVVRHDIAAALGLELGGNILLTTDEGSRVARVGAFAANGTPPVAAVLLPWSVGADLGVQRPNGLVLAIDDEQVEAAPAVLGDLLVGASVERRRPPQQQTATTGGSSRLEPFNYTDLGDGQIIIDPAWVQRYIRTVELPGIATTRCHEIMIPQLLAALDEVRAAGLYDHFKPEQFGGCWVARHIDWDPSKPLSNHAWGIAVDFNTHDNWLGDEPQMDRRIVAIFEKWGFAWGGHWRRPDGMHFELERIVRPADG